MRNRQEEIRSKGFDISKQIPKEFGKIKLNKKIVDDAVIRLSDQYHVGTHKRFNAPLIYKAIAERDLPFLREASNYFYDTNGIYSRICDYFANMYRYDWYIVPEVYDKEGTKEDKVKKDLDFLLGFLDNSYIKKVSGEIALSVIKNGAYYGYIVPSKNGIVLQELPIDYCRCLYNSTNMPVIEFNMRYFDDTFKDVNYRMKILNMFPEEFKKGYMLYKQGKLPSDDVRAWGHLGCCRESRILSPYCQSGWYALEVGSAIKFCFNNNDQPLFAKSIPAILDLLGSQGIDKQKQLQNLQKILVQHLPLDKNFDLVFDVEEARDIHENALEMLENNVGVDVITTFADIKMEDAADNSTSQSNDVLERMERGVYNAFGVSRNIFNSDTSLALEKSILDDESSLRVLLLQFSAFFDSVVKQLSTNKKYKFRFFMLETTQYNYKEMSKMYKEQVQIGYSKMLPQIALGHSQSSILHNAYFENEILHLSELMIPPLMSSTMNPDAIMGKTGQKNGSNSQNNTEEKTMGRPKKEDGERSEKTAQNLESL